MTEHLIKPAGAVIRSIDILYFIFRDGINLLEGLRFKDKDANTLLQCGLFCETRKDYINHTMVLNEDERVVGVRSKTWKDGSKPGEHYDIEFLLWKVK
jgi:hypothetical protein